MYKENRTTEHKRDSRGRIISLPENRKKEKSGFGQFVTAAVATLALALTATGLLLHASMQKNAENKAQIESMKRDAEIAREFQRTQNPTVPDNRIIVESNVPDAEEITEDEE